MAKPEITHYAWVDIETTGLDKSRDPIIEIAIILTNLDLEREYSFATPVNAGPGLLAARLKENPFVKEMHTKNGLLSCLESDRKWPTVEEAANWIIRTFIAKGLKEGGLMIAGSGVAQFDQHVIRHQIPKLDKWFAYHPMDIGVVRRFIKHTLKRPDLLLPPVESNHRAYDDVLHALDEARYYRDCLGAVPVIRSDEEQ